MVAIAITYTKEDILAKAKESPEYDECLRKMFPVVFEEWEDITDKCEVLLEKDKSDFFAAFVYHEGNMLSKLDSISFKILETTGYKLEGNSSSFKIYKRIK